MTRRSVPIAAFLALLSGCGAVKSGSDAQVKSHTGAVDIGMAVASAACPPCPTCPTCPAGVCIGDCDGNFAVEVNDMVVMINVMQGLFDIDRCRAGDVNGDGAITVEEFVVAVNKAQSGCP